MFNTLQDAFLDFFEEQKDIKEMSAKEFYNSLDKNSLNNIIVTYYILSNNEEDLKDFISYKPKKSEMIDFICENLKEIIKSCLINCELDTCNEILFIASKKGIRKFDDGNFKPLLSIVDLKLGCVKYDKKTKKMLVFIPEEIRKNIIRIFKDDNIIECIKENDNLGNIILGIMSTYGVIELNRLGELLEIDGNYLLEYILRRKVSNEICEICYNNGNILIGSIGLNEKFMLDLNEMHKKYNIRKYSLDDYKKIECGEYLESLKSYKKLVKYLKDEYRFSNPDLVMFRDLVVLNFINNIEEKEFNATEALYRDLDDFIKKDEVEYKKIEKMVKDIYKEYPKWEKFGNI